MRLKITIAEVDDDNKPIHTQGFELYNLTINEVMYCTLRDDLHKKNSVRILDGKDL